MSEWIDAVNAWLARYDHALELGTVWTLAVGSTVLALVKLVSWLTLRNQHDRTDVGRSLKKQKLSEAAAWTATATLYGLLLGVYYTGYVPGPWVTRGLYLVVMLGVLGAAVYGVRFIRALRRETRRGQ